MQPDGPDQGSLADVEGPPSARSRAALADQLRREVADARLRLEEATLRAEAHRLLGNTAAAEQVLREQEEILATAQAGLRRAVSEAVVQRDAEQVVADAVGPVVAMPVEDAGDPAAGPVAAPRRERAPALAGVASAVAVLAIAVAAVVGIDRGASVPVSEVAAGAAGQTDAPRTDALADLAPPRQVPLPGSTTPQQAVPPAADPTADDADAPAPAPAPTAPVAASGESEPGDTPQLDDVVEELIDAVEGLDDGGSQGPVEEELGVPLPDLTDPDESTEPTDEATTSPADEDTRPSTGTSEPAEEPANAPSEDGFVPRGAAQ